MMRLVSDFDTNQPFEVLSPPEQSVPFVFNSPHSGRAYPQSFVEGSKLDPHALRRSEDAFVDELFAGALGEGAVMMRAHFPRAYLDVNREPYELDPKMFESRLPPYANVRSIRVAGGLGTIARIVSETQEIYAGKLNVAEALARIETLYKPYHKALRRLLARSHVGFGYAVLIDCHSMPSASRISSGQYRPDFIIGDRYGTSCSAALSERALASLRNKGYSVSRNKPYAGGFITEHYGRPAKGLHALQVEVNRGIYMDEGQYRRKAEFEHIQKDLAELIADLVATPAASLWPERDLAAE